MILIHDSPRNLMLNQLSSKILWLFQASLKPVYVEVSAKLKDCCGQFFVCKQISDKWGVINFETKFVLFDSSFYHLILACDLPLWNGLSSTNDKHIPSFWRVNRILQIEYHDNIPWAFLIENIVSRITTCFF